MENSEELTAVNPMKAYLIDPFKSEVTEVEYDGNYESIYAHIHCETFDVVRIGEGDVIYIDDEGLLKAENPLNGQRWFAFNGYPLAGYGLVLGTDENGESIAPVSPFEWVKSMVTFQTVH